MKQSCYNIHITQRDRQILCSPYQKSIAFFLHQQTNKKIPKIHIEPQKIQSDLEKGEQS